MKILTVLLFIITTAASAQSLDAVRQSYIHVNEGDQAISLFEKSLTVTNNTNVLHAYRGALMTMQSRIVKGIKNKKMLFKDGVALMENAVKKEPNNIEVRTIRLSVQENAPKFLKYNKNIEEDKNFILTNYPATSGAVRSFVKGYVMQSPNFTVQEKTKF